jgi:hypothetical protein
LSTETIIDGISWQINAVPGIIGTFDSFEALEELRSRMSFAFEYGYSLGVTNFTLKSGTNGFHGNAFDILQRRSGG